MSQQFQIQDFDSRSSVVAQLRPLTQLSTASKDNAAKPEIDPCAGEFERRRIRLSILGVWGEVGER
jgi:hypothetical protein